jgi:hypothetical protein
MFGLLPGIFALFGALGLYGTFRGLLAWRHAVGSNGTPP